MGFVYAPDDVARRSSSRSTSMARERLLVNFFYAHPVGHAVEALHYCLGHHAADPSREIALALNADSAVGLAGYCPFVSTAYAIEHPFVEPCPDSRSRLAALPREWDWVLDDFRRHQDIQLELFAGMRDYYAASDEHLVAGHRSVVGADPPGYLPHQQLRFALPTAARAQARKRMAGDGPWIAVMPAGSSERALYPSVASWLAILDALRAALPAVRFALIGKLERDRHSSTSLARDELERLLAHESAPLDGFDEPLQSQLALVETSDVFLAPHTGFGLAALAVATPWLALSGGRWFEYFFNRVPFRSVIPDTDRYPSFSQFDPVAVVEDEDGPRTPSMSRARIDEDLDAIVAAAAELIDGGVGYEQALSDYFAALLRAHRGDATAIWSIDNVHVPYVFARR
jgi:hypothetical protein